MIPQTAVPGPTFGPTGFISPSDAAILTGVIADMQTAFGGALNFTTSGGSVINSTPQGQLASSLTAIIANTDATFLYFTQQVDPAYSSGRMQDAIGRIYFQTRIPALPTTLNINCIGAVNVTIPLGAQISDVNGFTYTNTAPVTIPASGSIIAQFANLLVGPNPIPGEDEVEIITTIPGWDAVQCLSGALGQNVEGRAAFEQRREDSVASNSFGAIGSVIGAIAGVAGVVDYFGYNNTSSSPVTVYGVTVPGNSVYLAVVGGTNVAVGAAIISKLSPGCGMAGNTTLIIYDNNPLYSSPIPYTISFERPLPLQILFAVDMVASAAVPAGGVALVQNAILNAFSGGFSGLQKARIASLLLASSYMAPITSLGSWAQIRTLTIGSGNDGDAAIFTGTVSTTNLTVTEVILGTIAVGQTISDQSGLIPAGTVIESQTSGPTGGAGVYVINSSLTIPGASFTGTGSGANLTTSAVTGTINIGDTVLGTGVPANTFILSQTSGTAGGAGVYVTSNSTTSSSAALTSTPTIASASADQYEIQVQANQEPALQVNNIGVAFT